MPTTLRIPTPMHSNDTLTETDVIKTNEKDIFSAHDTVSDSGRPRRQMGSGSEHMTDDSESDDVFWVDWEGPDDPANPRKCVPFLLPLN